MTCSDLDLKLFGDSRNGFLIEIVGSPDGRRESVPLNLPKDISGRLNRLRARVTDRSEAKNLGRELFDALFPPVIREIWLRMTGPNKTSRLRLDIRARELMNLPWELMHTGEKYLALSERTPIVRFLAENRSAENLEIDGPPNFLLVTSTPHNLPPLPGVRAEVDMIRGQLAAPESNVKSRAPVVIEHASLSALRAKIDRSHVVHYMGHGDFSDDRGYLWLENADGSGDEQEAEVIGNNMRDGAVRLLVLNACDTAIASKESLIGVAQAAHAGGVPVVVAMQQTILDSAAVQFAGGFYRALLTGKPSESCMVAGRLAIQEKLGLDSAEWAIPVMFSNAPVGKLCLLQAANEKPRESVINVGGDAYGNTTDVFSGTLQAGRDLIAKAETVISGTVNSGSGGFRRHTKRSKSS